LILEENKSALETELEKTKEYLKSIDLESKYKNYQNAFVQTSKFSDSFNNSKSSESFTNK